MFVIGLKAQVQISTFLSFSLIIMSQYGFSCRSKNMDLISDLGNDLAVAFLVEKRHGQKIESKEVLALIGRIRAALQPLSRSEGVSVSEAKEPEACFAGNNSPTASH